ncbi:unnamed protein product [Prorocentrum cordatum]|uniref:Uncharacterized protein n=1 Tax=Prorocentrum cordatum TaxID=2364126 RepID=A0ABN9TAQ5_9DINO|nr:unnamed protein product [Polarella glacialis]
MARPTWLDIVPSARLLRRGTPPPASLARGLSEYGFAVLRVTAGDAALFRRCAAAFARRLFLALPGEAKARLRDVDGGGTLRGWNRPSAAKEVFRVLGGDAGAPAGPSPLDVFHYPNDPSDEAAAEVANLAPHVDPGLVTLIPVAASPGLALRSPGLGRWCKVEADLGLEPLRHVVVFPGAALQAEAPGPGVRATVHLVYKSAGAARTSLVFELRERPRCRARWAGCLAAAQRVRRGRGPWWPGSRGAVQRGPSRRLRRARELARPCGALKAGSPGARCIAEPRCSSSASSSSSSFSSSSSSSSSSRRFP